MNISDKKQSFGSRLRAAMTQAGLHRSIELSRKMKRSPQIVSKWLKSGTQNISAADLFLLADTLKVSSRWLLYGEGSMSQYASTTPEERELLTIYQTLPEEWREDWVAIGRKTMDRLTAKPSIVVPYPPGKTDNKIK